MVATHQNKISAVILIALILSMPFSFNIPFVKADSTTGIITDVPDIHNSGFLDITGYTKQSSRVKVFVNGEIIRALTADAQGYFEFFDVPLVTEHSVNNIKLTAEDTSGQLYTFEKQVALDLQKPTLNLDQIPLYTQDEQLIIKGTVDELSKIEVTAAPVQSPMAVLPKVSGLTLKSQNRNSASLEWDPIDNNAVAGYVIYKDSKKVMAYSDNIYTDFLLNKSTSYTYRVAAYDHRCIEGPLSDPITVSAPDDAAVIIEDTPPLVDFCDVDVSAKTLENTNGDFTLSVPLTVGENVLIINATDLAGNSQVLEYPVNLETEKPVILNHNLDLLSPSYVSEIKVTGTVEVSSDQNVVVIAYINDENSYTVQVAEDGTFSMDIPLERTLTLDLDANSDYDPQMQNSDFFAQYGEGFGTAWKNKIKLIARSESGLESEPVERDVILANCGFGSSWSIRLGQPTPSTLTPRLMLEGFQTIGIPVEDIVWQGGGNEGTLSSVSVTTKLAMSQEEKEHYDLDWIQNVEYTHSPDYKKGFLLITLKKLDWTSLYIPRDDVSGEQRNEDELTTLELERFLAENRIGTGDCLIDEMGCAKIPLQLEIEFVDNNIPNETRLNRGRAEIETQPQRQCWDVMMSVDPPLPRDKIPEDLLKAGIEVLDSSIEAVTNILKFLRTVKEVVFYTCAGTIVLDFAYAFQESWDCEFSATLNVFSKSDEKWNPYIAATGQCDEKLTDDEQIQACEKCANSVERRQKFEHKMRWVCDRIFCPSAPTFQKYVKDMTNQYRPTVFWSAPMSDMQSRSDCAMKPAELSTTGNIAYPKDAVVKYNDIKNALENYDSEVKTKDDEKLCSELHIPTFECCGYEYMQQWDSACMIMNELKESKCLAAQTERTAEALNDKDCSGLRPVWNSVAGFCEADGSPNVDIIRIPDNYKGTYGPPGYSNAETKNKVYIAGDMGDAVYFRFFPEDANYASARFGGDATQSIRYAEIGYISQGSYSTQTTFTEGQPSRVASDRFFYPLSTSRGDVQSTFAIDIKTSDHNSPEWNNAAWQEFKTKYSTYTGTEETDPLISQIYRDLQDKVMVPTKEYIVDPTSGFLRSFQCVCLSGITSYLGIWKIVLESLRLCLQTVLLTGDGSPGVCKETLSMYVCDFIYDLISCFTKKYGAGQTRQYQGGIGSVIGAMTSAGQKVSSSVQGRYGQSGIWRSIFAEKKLANAVCIFAFSGTWDFDVSAVLDEDISMDVESIVVLNPNERRFKHPNPGRDGITTYNYRFALYMVAGSDLSYRVWLECSDDYSCSDLDPTGACDCVTTGAKKQMVTVGPGWASRGQTIDQSFLQDFESPGRYDKVVVEWTSKTDDKKSGKKEFKIKNVGGNPPAYCKLDLAEGMYRCILGFDTMDYIRFEGTAKPLASQFFPGDTLRVQFEYAQRQPKEVENYAGSEINPFTKFLQMKIHNRYGAVVYETPYYPFNGNGRDSVNDLPNYVLSETDFKRASDLISITSNPKDLVTANQLWIDEKNRKPTYPMVMIKYSSEGKFKVSDGITGRVINDDLDIRNNYIYWDNYIIKLTRSLKPDDLITVIYTDKDAGPTSLYYKYVSGAWQWSTDLNNWQSVNEEIVQEGSFKGEVPSLSQLHIIRFLAENKITPEKITGPIATYLKQGQQTGGEPFWFFKVDGVPESKGCTTTTQYWTAQITFYDKQPHEGIDEPSDMISQYQNEDVTQPVKIPVACKRAAESGGAPCFVDRVVTQDCSCGTQGSNPKICKPSEDPNLRTWCVYTGAIGNCVSLAPGETPTPEETTSYPDEDIVFTKVEYWNTQHNWVEVKAGETVEITGDLKVRFNARASSNNNNRGTLKGWHYYVDDTKGQTGTFDPQKGTVTGHQGTITIEKNSAVKLVIKDSYDNQGFFTFNVKKIDNLKPKIDEIINTATGVVSNNRLSIPKGTTTVELEISATPSTGATLSKVYYQLSSQKIKNKVFSASPQKVKIDIGSTEKALTLWIEDSKGKSSDKKEITIVRI